MEQEKKDDGGKHKRQMSRSSSKPHDEVYATHAHRGEEKGRTAVSRFTPRHFRKSTTTDTN